MCDAGGDFASYLHIPTDAALRREPPQQETGPLSCDGDRFARTRVLAISDGRRRRMSYIGSVLSLHLSAKIPNLDRHRIEVPCPLCDLTTCTTMGAVRLGDTVVCRGCHSNIRLQDHMATFHRFKRKFETMLKQLGR